MSKNIHYCLLHPKGTYHSECAKDCKESFKKDEQVIVMCANFLLRDRDVVMFLNPEGQAVMCWA